MQITTGPGVMHSYVYDSVNKRIVSRDGEKDDFVDFFEDNATDSQLERLNHWDSDIKRVIKDATRGGDWLDKMSKQADEIRFTVEILENGDKIWTFNYADKEHTMLEGYTYPYADYEQPNKERFYHTKTHQDYDPISNSISLAIGDSFDIEGSKFMINSENFTVEGVNDIGLWKKAEPYALALSHLMLFVEGIWGAYAITDDDTPIVLDFLKEQGVDTSKDFTVNNTKCHVVNGKIQEVGHERNEDPSSIQRLMQESLMQSMKWMSKSLA